MRVSLISGLIAFTALSACGGGVDSSHIPVCQEQSDWARNGKVPSGEIAISCPKHGIGDYR